jgi:hypothetical protein
MVSPDVLGYERSGVGDNPLVEFDADAVDDLYALFAALRGTAAVTVDAVMPPPVAGEQGSVLDFLTVACASGGAITTVVQIVRTLIESRGPKVRLSVRRGDDTLEISADNVDEVMPVLREMLGGS